MDSNDVEKLEDLLFHFITIHSFLRGDGQNGKRFQKSGLRRPVSFHVFL